MTSGLRVFDMHLVSGAADWHLWSLDAIMSHNPNTVASTRAGRASLLSASEVVCHGTSKQGS